MATVSDVITLKTHVKSATAKGEPSRELTVTVNIDLGEKELSELLADQLAIIICRVIGKQAEDKIGRKKTGENDSVYMDAINKILDEFPKGISLQEFLEENEPSGNRGSRKMTPEEKLFKRLTPEEQKRIIALLERAK